MTIQQSKPIHPGGMIERTYTEPFKKVTAATIARELSISKSTFGRLLAGKSNITPELAVRLSAVLGRSAESWLLMQSNYSLWKARKAVDTDELQRFDFTQGA